MTDTLATIVAEMRDWFSANRAMLDEWADRIEALQSSEAALVAAGKQCYEALRLHSPCNGRVTNHCLICEAVAAYAATQLDTKPKGE